MTNRKGNNASANENIVILEWLGKKHEDTDDNLIKDLLLSGGEVKSFQSLSAGKTG